MSLDVGGPEDWLKVIEAMDDGLLKNAIKVVMDPPRVTSDYYRGRVRNYGVGMPPQPHLEYIDRGQITKLLGEDGATIFMSVDQLVSLSPRSVRRILEKPSALREEIEVVRKIGKIIHDEYVRHAGKLSVKDLLPEDYRKNTIMLVLPSWRQLGAVRGRWRELAWREKTLTGEETPSLEGWMRDAETIVEALRGEGIKTIVVADRVLEERVKSWNVEKIFTDIGEGLCKIGYARDSSMTWFRRPVIANMALPFRRGEEEILVDAYWDLGLVPVMRPRWVETKRGLKRISVEGGNFFLISSDGEAALVTGIGVRGTDVETFTLLDRLLPRDVKFFGVPLSGYLKDWLSGVVHLDVVFLYLGETGEGRVALIDPSRMGFYCILEYERGTGKLTAKSFIEFARELDLVLDEPPRIGGSPITMVNALNLGGGKLVVDSYNREVNRYLEREFKIELIEVDIPQIEAGGGGPRCATRDIPIR